MSIKVGLTSLVLVTLIGFYEKNYSIYKNTAD